MSNFSRVLYWRHPLSTAPDHMGNLTPCVAPSLLRAAAPMGHHLPYYRRQGAFVSMREAVQDIPVNHSHQM